MNRLNWKLWQRFWAIARLYWFSEEKRGAIGLLGLLLLFLLLFNGMTVVLNYINRDLITALTNKDASKFFRMALLFFGVLVLAAPVNALYKYMERKLELYWRRWLTNHFLDKYFQNRAFYQINSNTNLDNPDQRISEDIRTFIETTLNVASTLCFSIIQIISFTGILWSISIPLVIVVFVYAVFGTVLTVLLGKRLIGLNFNQLKREADFRFSLVHIREHAESIAFYQGENQESGEVKRRFSEAIKNFNSLIRWQRNLAFFTNGY